MKRIQLIASLLFLVTLSFSQYSGKITRVADGETFWIKLSNGDIDSVKIWGIDVPELDQPFGNASKLHLEKQIHREVQLKYKTRDRDNYMLAIVTYTTKSGLEVNLNYSMVEDGYAWKRKILDDKDLEKLQKSAQKNHRGLWKKPNAIPPWEWRESHR